MVLSSFSMLQRRAATRMALPNMCLRGSRPPEKMSSQLRYGEPDRVRFPPRGRTARQRGCAWSSSRSSATGRHPSPTPSTLCGQVNQRAPKKLACWRYCRFSSVGWLPQPELSRRRMALSARASAHPSRTRSNRCQLTLSSQHNGRPLYRPAGHDGWSDASLLDPQLWRSDGTHWTGTEPRQDVALQLSDDLVRVLRVSLLLLLGEPFTGGGFEAVGGCGLASGIDGLHPFVRGLSWQHAGEALLHASHVPLRGLLHGRCRLKGC